MSGGRDAHGLDRFPRAIRIADHDAWLADPDDIVATLTGEGFEEYRREIIRCRRDRRPLGGMWQALQRSTGHVASVLWLTRGTARPAIVFVDFDDQPACQPGRTRLAGWWDDVDQAVLDCLSGGTPMAPADVARRVGISEEAAASVIAMLAQEGRLRICLVAPADTDLVERSFWCATRAQHVTAQFLESHLHATPMAVTWCTAFAPPTAVRCDRTCVSGTAAVAAGANAA
jgi:hypothetical protein